MTEPTTGEMRDWLNAASPQTQIKYQWVDILLNRLAESEQEVKNAHHDITQLMEINTELLNP